MKRFLSTAMMLLIGIAAAAAEPEMKEGQWEITMVTEMPGMPFAVPPMKQAMCLTKENMVPQQAESGQDCSFKEKSFKGNTATWAVDCKESGSSVRSEGSVTYNGDTFQGTIRSVVRQPGQGEMAMNQKISGRRLGPCK